MSDTTTTKRKPTKPRGPKKSGSKLWREIADPKKYELRPDELRILEDACRVTERVAELDLADLLSATESNGAEPASAGRLV